MLGNLLFRHDGDGAGNLIFHGDGATKPEFTVKNMGVGVELNI